MFIISFTSIVTTTSSLQDKGDFSFQVNFMTKLNASISEDVMIEIVITYSSSNYTEFNLNTSMFYLGNSYDTYNVCTDNTLSNLFCAKSDALRLHSKYGITF